MSPLPTTLTSAPDAGLSDVSDGEAAPGAADDAFATDGGSPMVHISSPPKVVAAPPDEEVAPGDPPAKAEVKRRRLRKVQGEAEGSVPGGKKERVAEKTAVAEKTPVEAVGSAGGKTRLGRLRKAGEGPQGAGADGGETRATEDLNTGAAGDAAKGTERPAKEKALGDAEKVETVKTAGVTKDTRKLDVAGRGVGLKGVVQTLKKGGLKKVGKKGGVPVFVARAAGEKTNDSPRMRAEGWAVLALAAFPAGADVPKVEKKRGTRAEPGEAGSVPVVVKKEGGEGKGVGVVAAAPGKKGGRLRKRQGEIAEAVMATVSEAGTGAKLEEPQPEPKLEAAPPDLPAEESKPAAEEATKPVEKANAAARGAKKGAAKAGGLPGRPPPRRSSRFEKFDFGAAFQGSPTEFSLPEEWLWEEGGRKNRRMSIRVPSTEEGAPDQVLEAQIDELGVRRARAASIEREIEAAQIEAVAEGKSEFVRGEGGAAENENGGEAAPPGVVREGAGGAVDETEAQAGHGLQSERDGDKGAEAGAVSRAAGKGGKKGKGKKQKGGRVQVESTAGLAREAGPGVEAGAGALGGAANDPAMQPASAGDVLGEEESGGRLGLLSEAGDAGGVGREQPGGAPAPDALELGWADAEAQPFVGAVYTRAGKRKGAKGQARGSGAAKEAEEAAVTGDGEPGPSVTPGKKRPAKGGRKSGAVEEAGGGAGIADVGDSGPSGLAASGLESSPRLLRRVSTRRGAEQSQLLELDMGLPSPEYKRKKGGKGEAGGEKKNEGGEGKQGGGLEEGGTQETEPAGMEGTRDHSLVGEPPRIPAAASQLGGGDGQMQETEETDEAADRSDFDKSNKLRSAGTLVQGGEPAEEDAAERPSRKESDLAQSGAKDAQDTEPGEKEVVLRQPETDVATVGEERSGLEEPGGVSADLDESRPEQQRDTCSPTRDPPAGAGGLGRSGVIADDESEAAIRGSGQRTDGSSREAGPAGVAAEDGSPVKSAHQELEVGGVPVQAGGEVRDVTLNEGEGKEGGGG